MTRRTDRVASMIRETLGQLLMAKLADPRVDPARTSIVRVEITEDLLLAKVFISVMGTEAQQRTTLNALRHAAGHIQELLGARISLRNTPRLDFRIDVQFKKTLKTLEILQEISQELQEKDGQDPEAAEVATDGDDRDD